MKTTILRIQHDNHSIVVESMDFILMMEFGSLERAAKNRENERKTNMSLYNGSNELHKRQKEMATQDRLQLCRVSRKLKMDYGLLKVQEFDGRRNKMLSFRGLSTSIFLDYPSQLAVHESSKSRRKRRGNSVFCVEEQRLNLSYVLSGGNESTIKLWEVETGRLVKRYWEQFTLNYAARQF